MSIVRLLVSGFAISMVSASALAGQQICTGDFNGDGKSDLAVGVPFEDIGSIVDCGAVEVLYGRGVGLKSTNDEFWNQNKPGVLDNAEGGDHFGRAVAAGDFDGDGFDDLAISSDEDGGIVQILYGANNGLNTLGNQLFNQANSSGGLQGVVDAFGSALAVGDFDGDGFDDLAVGEPNDTVFGTSGAGSVTVLYGSAGGLGQRLQYWNQDSPGVADQPEGSNGAGTLADTFGTSLAAGDFDGDGRDDLAIGVPGEDVGNIIDAGIVQVLYGTPTGLTGFGSDLWSQNSPDVADSCESGDQFGMALAAGDFDGNGKDDLAIGTPFEKIASQIHAGAVNVLYGRGPGLSATNNDLWHQNRAGIADSCETDDAFGAAMTTGDFDGDGFDDLAIAVPEEDIEDETDDSENAGGIEVLYGAGGGLRTNFSQFWTLESPHMDGDPKDARFGTCVAAGDFDNDGFVDLAGAAPREKVDAVNNAGAVHLLYGSAGRLISGHANKFWHQNISGVADECETNDAFGGTAP